MDAINTCFYDKHDGDFFNYLAKVEFQFEDKIPEYHKLTDDEELILDKLPDLRKVLDDKEVVELSEKEVNGLLEIIQLRELKEEYLIKTMFFKGYKEAYYFFKKIGLLTEEEQCSH